ncbi:hypothetical protein PLICRDRAFT_30507 [Plicaturopsis crispa FD-325 SS-3]|nr:hypothetical protein PLICRDRAFT_30507 [Plicaturopsis crispa FD-325 SS-3]
MTYYTKWFVCDSKRDTRLTVSQRTCITLVCKIAISVASTGGEELEKTARDGGMDMQITAMRWRRPGGVASSASCLRGDVEGPLVHGCDWSLWWCHASVYSSGMHLSLSWCSHSNWPAPVEVDDRRQTLRDVGYTESAATLEAESGYSLESMEVSEFRDYIIHGAWPSAEAALQHLAIDEEEALLEAKFLISQQKYLELLEARKTTAALHVLRDELAQLGIESDKLHALSSLIMCSDPADVRRRARWDGASGSSRRELLSHLQHSLIMCSDPADVRRRARWDGASGSSRRELLSHLQHATRPAFPRVTTTILSEHSDEVWNIAWSHNGLYLASTSKDKCAIVWHIGPEADPSKRMCAPTVILWDHPFPVGYIAWSLDDSVLLTSAENYIKLWNTQTGACLRVLQSHTDTVSSLLWLPDGSGFVSGGLDRKIIFWDSEGMERETWGAIRVTDLAVTPDFTRLVAVGIYNTPPAAGGTENRIVVYNMATKEAETSIRLEGELTSVKISQDSQYALISHAPDEIHIWELSTGRLTRKFTGQRQGNHVIRSCFGGVDGNFVVSGSEDGNVYIWHRDTGALLEMLSGHGAGSVNSVSWNPTNERMFASCSDDSTIRIWEALPSTAEGGGGARGAGAAREGTRSPGSGENDGEKGAGSTGADSRVDEPASVYFPSHPGPSPSQRRAPGMGLLSALSCTLHGMTDVDPETARRNGISKSRETISQLEDALHLSAQDLKRQLVSHYLLELMNMAPRTRSYTVTVEEEDEVENLLPDSSVRSDDIAEQDEDEDEQEQEQDNRVRLEIVEGGKLLRLWKARDKDLPPIWEVKHHPLRREGAKKTYVYLQDTTREGLERSFEVGMRQPMPLYKREKISQKTGYLEMHPGDAIFARDCYGSGQAEDDRIQAWGSETYGLVTLGKLRQARDTLLGPEAQRSASAPSQREDGTFVGGTRFERTRGAIPVKDAPHRSAKVESELSAEDRQMRQDFLEATTEAALEGLSHAPDDVIRNLENVAEMCNVPCIGSPRNKFWPSWQVNIAHAEAADEGQDMTGDMGSSDMHIAAGSNAANFARDGVSIMTPKSHVKHIGRSLFQLCHYILGQLPPELDVRMDRTKMLESISMLVDGERESLGPWRLGPGTTEDVDMAEREDAIEEYFDFYQKTARVIPEAMRAGRLDPPSLTERKAGSKRGHNDVSDGEDVDVRADRRRVM